MNMISNEYDFKFACSEGIGSGHSPYAGPSIGEPVKNIYIYIVGKKQMILAPTNHMTRATN
jgi:hypothetical protein